MRAPASSGCLLRHKRRDEICSLSASSGSGVLIGSQRKKSLGLAGSSASSQPAGRSRPLHMPELFELPIQCHEIVVRYRLKRCFPVRPTGVERSDEGHHRVPDDDRPASLVRGMISTVERQRKFAWRPGWGRSRIVITFNTHLESPFGGKMQFRQSCSCPPCLGTITQAARHGFDRTLEISTFGIEPDRTNSGLGRYLAQWPALCHASMHL